MLMVCHHLDSKIPEDTAFAESVFDRRRLPRKIFARSRGHFDYVQWSSDGARGRSDCPHLADGEMKKQFGY